MALLNMGLSKIFLLVTIWMKYHDMNLKVHSVPLGSSN